MKKAQRSFRRPGLTAAAAAFVLSAAVASPAGAQIRYPFLPAMEAVPDARSLALGRAYTAIADGPSGVWWNPGALGMPRAWEASFLTDAGSKSFLGGDLGVYAISGRRRDLGVAFHLVRVGESDYGSVRKKADFLAQAGLGEDLAGRLRLADPRFVRWGVGGSLKVYHTGFSSDGSLRGYRASASAVDVDAGSLLSIRLPLRSGRTDPAGDSALFPADGGPRTPYVGLRVGGVIRNALSRKVQLGEGESGKFPLGNSGRGGIALEAGSAPLGGLGAAIAGTISAELAAAMEERAENPMRSFGIELRLIDMIALRYGEIHDPTWRWKGVTRGIGFQIGLPGIGGVRFDWAEVPYPCCSEPTEQVTVGMWTAL